MSLASVQYVTLVSILCGLLASLLHRVDHGYICVYFRGGYLINKISGPGIHVRLPIITDTLKLPVKPKAEQLAKIDCTTSDGVKLTFDQVQVVYSYITEEILQTLSEAAGLNPTDQLIRLPIKRALQQFCEKRDFESAVTTEFHKLPAFLKHRITKTKEHQNSATLTSYFKNNEIERNGKPIYTFQTSKSGIRVHDIHIARPKCPDSRIQMQLELESSRQKSQIERERQAAAVAKAKLDVELAEILGRQRENDKLLAQKVAQIQDVMDFERAKARADAEAYKIFKLAEANRALFTEDYFSNLEYAKLQKLEQ